MTDGAAPPLPPQNDGGRGGGAGLWAWARPVSIGLLLAAVLLVLLAGLLNDLLPGTGGGVISGPTPSPTPSVSVLPTTTESPSATDGTGEGTGEGTGTGGGTGGGGNDGGGGGNNGGGSGNNGGGSSGGGGNRPTDAPVPTPTRTGLPPTPTQTPPTSPPIVVGPDRCTVYTPPGFCVTRQLLKATVNPGAVSLTNRLGGPQLGHTASLVALSPGSNASGPSVGGKLESVVVTDRRGSNDGWTVTANVAWPGGAPEGVVVTVNPTCAIGDLNSAPGVVTGPAAQPFGTPVTMCSKDAQVGTGGSTSGVYMVGGYVSVSTWIGTPIPATALLVTYSIN